jgi:hypothetical protein
MFARIAGAWLARVAARFERVSGRLRRWAETRAAEARSASAAAVDHSSAPLAVADDEHGPPADWLERVRRGAPHLLVAMRRRHERTEDVRRPVLPMGRRAAVSAAQPPATKPRLASPAAVQGAEARALNDQRARDPSRSGPPAPHAPNTRQHVAARAPEPQGMVPSPRAQDGASATTAEGALPAGRVSWIRWPGSSEERLPRRALPMASDMGQDRAPMALRAAPTAPTSPSRLDTSEPSGTAARARASGVQEGRALDDADLQLGSPVAHRSSFERATGEHTSVVRSALERSVDRAQRSPARAAREDSDSWRGSAPIRPAPRTPVSDPSWPFPWSTSTPPGAGPGRRGEFARELIHERPCHVDDPPRDPWPTLPDDGPSERTGPAPTHTSAEALERANRRQEGAPWSV